MGPGLSIKTLAALGLPGIPEPEFFHIKSRSEFIIISVTRDICFQIFSSNQISVAHSTERVTACGGETLFRARAYLLSRTPTAGVYDDKVHVTRVKRIEV